MPLAQGVDSTDICNDAISAHVLFLRMLLTGFESDDWGEGPQKIPDETKAWVDLWVYPKSIS